MMSNGIRVRLRRSSASEFEIRTDHFELISVVRGPPTKIRLRRLPAPAKPDKNKKEVKPEHVEIKEETEDTREPFDSDGDHIDEIELEPEFATDDLSSDGEKGKPSDDRLTSRQRSMKMAQEAEGDEEDEEDEEEEEQEDLGPISKEEAALRKSEMRRRRRQALDKIEEQAKHETIERLLKKTSVRKAKSDRKRQRSGDDVRRSASERRQDEMKVAHPGVIRYRSFIDGDRYLATITLPDGYNLGFGPHPPRTGNTPVCACGKPRLYSCAKTMQPLCSLVCYQQLHMKSA